MATKKSRGEMKILSINAEISYTRDGRVFEFTMSRAVRPGEEAVPQHLIDDLAEILADEHDEAALEEKLRKDVEVESKPPTEWDNERLRIAGPSKTMTRERSGS